MQDAINFLGEVSTLSSTGLFGSVFTLLGAAGEWADAVSKILGLAG